MFFNVLNSTITRIFPVAGFAEDINSPNRPEVPRRVDSTGYNPLPGYRDASPLFQPMSDHYRGATSDDLDSQDFEGLEDLMNRAQKGEFDLILVEMPINDPSSFINETMQQIASLARQKGIPYLSTQGLAPLPATAYTDQIHMQVTGSLMFSQWLGTQIGHAVASGELSDVEASVWTPTLETWDDSIFMATLGLNETRYADYLTYQDNFDLLPAQAIVFNPGDPFLDRELLQSLAGLTVDWQGGLTSEDHLDIFQLMVVLEKMRYQGELNLSASEKSAIDRWRTTADSALLDNMGIEYILCRVELVDSSITHCPDGIANNPNYSLIADWDFTPLYERYDLYQLTAHS
jgi:hypothetical protein